MNKFTDYYSQKSVSELLRTLLRHKIELSRLDKIWHDELVNYLTSLNLQGKSRGLFHKISDSTVEQIYRDEKMIYADLAEVEKEEERTNPLIIDAKFIRDAGQKFKMLAYVLIVTVLFNILMGVILSTDLYYGDWVHATTTMVVGSLILSTIMLVLLFTAGSRLEKSVRRKTDGN